MARASTFLFKSLGEQIGLLIFINVYWLDIRESMLLYCHERTATDATEKIALWISRKTCRLKSPLVLGMWNHEEGNIALRRVPDKVGGTDRFLTYSYPFPVVIYRFIVWTLPCRRVYDIFTLEEHIMIWNDPKITWFKMCLLENLWIEGMKRRRQNGRTYGSIVTTGGPYWDRSQRLHEHGNTKRARNVCKKIPHWHFVWPMLNLYRKFVTLSWFVLVSARDYYSCQIRFTQPSPINAAKYSLPMVCHL